MVVTAGLVSELRKLTSAGMMDCKKALERTNGDLQQAQDLLRKEGKAKADKKSGRIAAEGKIVIAIDPSQKKAAIAEVNCETDFVARSDEFNQYAQQIVDRVLALQANDVDNFLTQKMSANQPATIDETRQELIAKIGENISIRRIKSFTSNNGKLTAYVHGGRIGVLIDLQNADEALGKDLAMHIAASNPIVVNPQDVPADVLAKEKEIYAALASNIGKPDDVVEKMVAGRLKKYVNEVSLLGQPFVKDPSLSVEKILNQSGVKVNQFVRYEVSEGVEKQSTNFADEVAQLQGN